uniref:RING-type domain-containing protein n=1 Tax=viral metagenome TaxID=1070528 RepID=A0A6C0KXK0_9ZZZZ
MTNYNIEGGINFYETLFKMLDDDEKNETSQNLCLITNEPLTENYVTLECNHKFNYLPLFNDVKNHKKNFNKLETYALRQNEIRCPYCRNTQTKLLPCYEGINTSMKVIGVNVMPEPPQGYEIGTCCYYSVDFIKHKYCSINVKLLDFDNKTYCTPHYNSVQMKFLEEKALKEKIEAKKKAKEEAKKAKMEAKQKAKEELKEAKKKAKEEAKQKAKEDTAYSGCNQIVKSGKNKGNQCNCKIYKDSVCKRHYKSEVIVL